MTVIMIVGNCSNYTCKTRAELWRTTAPCLSTWVHFLVASVTVLLKIHSILCLQIVNDSFQFTLSIINVNWMARGMLVGEEFLYDNVYHELKLENKCFCFRDYHQL